MSTTLDPRIAAKLDAFAHRRRRLIIFRGICAAVAMLLAAMMVVALIDWIFVLPDGLRWGLSIAAYLAVIVVAWRASGRLLLHAPDSRNLARLIEGAEPSLREELLSAVELGQGSAEWDSEQFRGLVQADVSNRVADLKMERLLPAVLLKSAVGALAIMLVLCFIAMVVPSLRFGALLVRALAPGANLDRVSSVQVKIIQPNPMEMAVPQGDSVPLLVELTGRRVTKAYLETFTKSGGRAMVQLQPAPGGRFSAGIQVSREDVQYRIRAFDAITRKYHLQAAARPSVVSFHKVYTFPKYTELPPKTVDEENGDLTAVEGSEVELAVTTNQPVKAAVISVEAGHKTTEIPLTKRDAGQWTAKMPLKTAGVYRVELVSEATGFENKFNPEYELRVLPDTIPQITLQTPDRDLIASANEVVGITATATDDISVVKVEQQVKINDGKWAARPLSQQRAAEVKIDERWDLFQQGVHPGDSVMTKLVATDCKGNRGESRPISIIIAASGFDRARLDALSADRQLMKDVAAWQIACAALEQKYTTVRKLIENNPAGEVAARKAAMAELVPMIDQCTTLAAAAQAQIVTAIRLVTPGHETANLVLFSRCISQGEALLHFVPRQLQVAAVDPMPEFARDFSRATAETFAAIGRRAKLASDSFSRFEIAEEIDVINENLQVIVREQNRLATMAQNSGDDKAKWAPVAGRMKVVLAEVASTEEGMKAAAAVAPDYTRDRLVRLQKRLTDQRTDATAALAKPVPSKALLAPALSLAKAATELTVAITEMKREHTQASVSYSHSLRGQVEPSWIGFDHLRPEVEEVLRLDKVPEPVRGDVAGGRWDARAAMWKAYGDAEELRPDADAAFVKDVRSLRLALDGVRDQLVVPAPPADREPGWKRVGALDQAYRVLEISHDLSEMATGFDLLGAAERYQSGGVRAKTGNVTDFLQLWQRLVATDSDINRTNLLNPETRKLTLDVKALLSRIPSYQPARSLNDEMRQRVVADRDPVLQAVPAEKVAGLVREALAMLRPAVDEARKVLKEAAPKLSERLAQLAKEAKNLEADNAAKAEEKADKPPEQAKAEAKQNLAEQQKLNEKVDAVKDAIRAEANLQNVLEKEGREKARDADDALAMLKDPPPRAEEALKDAVNAERPAENKDALKAAASEDKKLADALDKLAEHFDAVDKGDADKTRLALREEEKKLGVKNELDQQYAKTEELAKTAEESPEGMLAKLEKALEKNPLMRQELSNVSRDLLNQANTKLALASKNESAIAREVEKIAAAQPKPPAPTPQANGSKPPATANPQANGEKPPATANPPANGEKPPESGKPQANGEKPPTANPQPNGEKPPANGNPPPEASKTAANPPANGEKSPGDPSANANAPKPAAPNPALTKAADMQKPIAKNANEAGETVERAGRHEERLKNEKVGQDLQKLGADVQATAQNQVPKAEQALAKGDAPAEANDAVGAAEKELKDGLNRLTDAQGGQPQTPPKPDGAMPPAGATPPAGAKPDAGAKPANTAKNDGAPKPEGAKPDGAAPAGPANTSAAKPDGAAKPDAGGKPNVAKADGGSPAAGSAKPPGETPAGQTPPGTPDGATPPPGGDDPVAQLAANTPAPPQQQVWMARALDALDAALHANPAGNQPPPEAAQGDKPGQPGAPKPGQGQQPSDAQQAANDAAAQAAKAMAAAGQAAAAEMRANRSPTPPGQPGAETPKDGDLAASKTGAKADANGTAYGKLAGASVTATGNWGKLPKQIAEQLTQGSREAVSAEYQKEVETYYRVIAERARKTAQP